MADYQERREDRYERLGQAVGGLFKDRWDAKEAEEFMSNEFQMFEASTTEFRNSVSTIEDGDQLAGAFMEWKNRTLMPFITHATARYGNNERVMTIVKQVYDANNQGMDDYIKVEEYGHSRGQRGEREDLAKQKAEAEIGLTEAQTGKEKALTGQAEATTGLREAQAEKARRQEEQEKWPTLPHNASLLDARNAVRNVRISHPAQTTIFEQRADAMAVGRIISERRGQDKADGTKWGQDSEKDQNDAGIEWAASGNRNKVLEAAVAKELGFNLALGQGYYDEAQMALEGAGTPLTPEEKVPPLKAGAKTHSWLGRLLATTSDDLRQRGFNVESMEGFIDDTLSDLPQSPTGYRQLGPHVSTVLEKTVVRDPSGELVSSVTGEPVKNYGQLGKHLLANWDARVTGSLISPEATAMRSQTQHVGKAIIAKYAPVIALELGIPIPKPVINQMKREGEPFFLQLLRSGTEAAQGKVPSLLKKIGLGEEEL